MKQTSLKIGRLLGMAVCTLTGTLAMAQTGTAARTMLPARVDLTRMVTVPGNVRPEALEARYDRGALAPETQLDHVFVLLKRSPEREAALEQFLHDVNDTGSPVFHQWLTPKQLNDHYGPAPSDVAQVVTWLESKGLRVNTVYATGTMLDVSGPSRAYDNAFHVGMHALNVNGEEHVANTADPQIPAALAGVMSGVVSLNSFKPHSLHRAKMRSPINPKTGMADPAFTFTYDSTQYEAVTPGDLKVIYNLQQMFNAGFTGQGQTVGLIEDTDLYVPSGGTYATDWNTFRSTFGLSGYTQGSLAINHPAPASGGTACTTPGTVKGDAGEAALDAEYASASAPSAAIVMEDCKGTRTTFGGLIALQNLAATGTSPKLISMSYGESEVYNGATANAAYNTVYQSLVAQGVTVFVSSGDEGAASSDADLANATHGIGVSGFASTPYNVAVGGTDFSDTAHGTVSTYWNTTNNADYSSAKSYIEEQPWNDSCASRILTKSFGYSTPYGSSGFCNSSTATTNSAYLSTGGGSGGPSGCATGTRTTAGVVSGTCAGYSKPAFQGVVSGGTFTGVYGVPNDGVRDIPDVSLFAANGLWGHYYPYCYSNTADSADGGVACTGTPDNWSGAGGTSFSSPILAGIHALLNQVTGSAWGNVLPTYYNLGAKQYGSTGNDACNSSYGGQTSGNCAFHDVTIGEITVNCTGSNNCYIPSGTYGVLSTSNSAYAPAYRSTPGWDFATGLGTVNAGTMINQWNTVNHSTPSYH